jgi:hypothetical protein
MSLGRNIRKKITALVFIALSAISLASCSSKEPIAVSVSGPPLGQGVSAVQRLKFARSFGDRFRAKFGDSDISTSGEAGKTLVIKWINVSRPFASKFAANEEIVKDLREMGFKRIILTDGYRSNWDVDLKN